MKRRYFLSLSSALVATMALKQRGFAKAPESIATTGAEMTNVEVVKQCYEKFKKGDIPGLLVLFDPRIEFRLAEGHPYQVSGKPWIGGQEITEHFFKKAGPEWQNWDVLIADILEASDAVTVECRYVGVYKPTGRSMDIQVCHIWRLRDGKVTSFHQYIDTARLQKVMGYGST